MKKTLFVLGILSMLAIAACAQQAPSESAVGGGSEIRTGNPAAGDQEKVPAGAKEADQGSQVTAETPVPGNEDVPETEVAAESNVVELDMIAKQWEFEPSKVNANVGDKVILHIKSVDVSHGFALPDFGVSQRLEPGKTETVEFTADKAGEFSFFCNVACGSGHKGMRGQLVVS